MCNPGVRLPVREFESLGHRFGRVRHTLLRCQSKPGGAIRTTSSGTSSSCLTGRTRPAGITRWLLTSWRGRREGVPDELLRASCTLRLNDERVKDRTVHVHAATMLGLPPTHGDSETHGMVVWDQLPGSHFSFSPRSGKDLSTFINWKLIPMN